MKSITYFVVLGVVGLIALTQATDYCSPSLCSKGKKHIGCKNSGDFSKSCPKQKKLINITEALKKLILDLHNKLRNDLAGDKVSNYKGATRMASMEWDDELAKLAEMHVKDCQFDHDECHSTPKFTNAGQNLAQTWYSGSQPTYESTFDDLIKSWWDEKKDANMNVINKFPRNWDGEVITHFTGMALEANTHLGCAAIWMIDPTMENMDSVMLTCNYAVLTMINEPVYEAGATASKCKTGKHPTYTNLCSPKETY